MAKCPACQTRKGKRKCPALEDLICSVCCGTKREKEIQCPPDCKFLGKSKQHSEERRKLNFEREMRSIIRHEDQHLDTLQNIESSIYQTYLEEEDITDRDVETAVEYLYEQGKTRIGMSDTSERFLTPKEQQLVDAIEGIFALREEIVGQPEPEKVKLKCLYRILESVRNHKTPHNHCAYLVFIGQFLP
jgi:hypothetical protein